MMNTICYRDKATNKKYLICYCYYDKATAQAKVDKANNGEDIFKDFGHKVDNEKYFYFVHEQEEM